MSCRPLRKSGILTALSLALLWVGGLAYFSDAQTLFALPRPARIDSLLKADSLDRAEKLRKAKAKPDTVDFIRGEGDSAAEDSEAMAGLEADAEGETDPGSVDPKPATPAKPAAKVDYGPNDTLGVADDTVEYQAERIRYRNDRFSLSEGAWLTYRGSKLVADSIVYFHEANLVEAYGAPLITDKVNPAILGYRMRYNIKRRVGEVYWGSSRKDKQVFNGVEVRRQRNGAIYIARGDFSTCDAKPDQHFYFYGRRMIVEPNAKVLSGPIVMNIAEVPVAVLPMLVMPLGSGRRSGLLQPKFGGDQAQGFYMTGLGYYWAISDYTDFLVSGDLVEGPQGTFSNTNFDARYALNVRSVFNGDVGGKVYVSDFEPNTAGWTVDFRSDWTITPDGRQTIKGSGTFQSEPDVVSRNALTEEDRTRQIANANLGYRRQFKWNGALLNVNLAQTNNLADNLLDRNIPDATFSVGGPLFPPREMDEDEFTDSAGLAEEPFYRKINWSYSNHVNVNQVSKPAKTGILGDTNTYAGYTDAFSINGKYSLLQYINVTPSFNARQMWSLMSYKGDSLRRPEYAFHPSEQEAGDYFAGWNTSASFDTRLYGIAQAQPDHPWFGVLQGVRHTVAPTVSMTYAPEIDSNTHFAPNPKLGGTAYQAEQRTVGLSLGNDVDLKFHSADSAKKADPYKLLTLQSATNYNFARQTQEWSDISTNLNLYFTRNIAFALNLTHTLYDPYSADPNALTSPILTQYSFGWRKGLAIDGGFSNGLRVKNTSGPAGSEYNSSPWSMDLNYSFAFDAARVSTTPGNEWMKVFGFSEVYKVTRSHQASGRMKFNPTQSWQLSYDTDYNFADGEFSRHNFSIHRQLHCWEMDFRWTPVGLSEGWSFLIRIIDLPDIKLETADRGLRKSR
jgi:LptD protein